MLENLTLGFGIALSYSNLAICFAGCTLGTIIGVLPGLGPVATIAMLLPLTYKLDLTSAIIMLSGIYYGAQYGGTITSVLLNIPGEASTIVTCFDGYEMARQGRAGKALGIAAFGSFIAGTFGIIFLSLLAPLLSNLALMFGPTEYAALMILGLTLVVYLGRGSPAKAALMGAVGLALSTIGMDPIDGYERFNYGSIYLMEGINIATLGMGMFGIAEILNMAESAEARSSRDLVRCPKKMKDLLPDRQDWKDSAMPITRGGILGFLLGILPGGGALLASFASYVVEKKFSRHPENFGKGAIEGVAGPEAANNAATSGAYIPLLTLGIPSNSVMALMAGAFIMHGVVPGPLIIKNHPDLFWGIIASMYVGNVILLVLNVPLIRVFVKIIEVPYAILSPLIIMICVIGAFSINNNPLDVIAMLVFGGVGYLMGKFDYDTAPLLLAYILGPILERTIRQSLVLSQGSLMVFITHRISLVLLSVAFLMVLSPFLMKIWSRLRQPS
ncbi:MAG: tripartite tricarboxylate transporter permease [Desulfobacterales bacterium]|nr:tripartite tricarboxylate transporter permease [Desulfobacterales bacterium]